MHGSLFEAIFLDLSGRNPEVLSQPAVARTSAEDLLKVARAQGMTTLIQAAVIEVIHGWTDFKQLKSVAIE